MSVVAGMRISNLRVFQAMIEWASAGLADTGSDEITRASELTEMGEAVVMGSRSIAA
jgi:hypothetical protein